MIKYLIRKQEREEDFRGLIKKIDLFTKALNMGMPLKVRKKISNEYIGLVRKLAEEYAPEYLKAKEEGILKITRPYLFQKNNEDEETNCTGDGI